MIPAVSDIEMTATIEEQASGIRQPIRVGSLPIATNDHRSSFRTLLPTHHSMVRHIYYIDMSTSIHPHSLRTRQLCQISTLLVSTSHDDTFFGSFSLCHHTMIVQVRDVKSALSIDEEVGGAVKLIEFVSFSMTASDETVLLIATFVISSHFMLLLVTDVEGTLIVHGQPATSDVLDDNLTLMRPTHDPSIPSITDEKSIGVSIHDDISWLRQLIQSIILTVTTCQYFTCRRTCLPCHDTAIPAVSDVHCLIRIDTETMRMVELIPTIPLTTTTCHGHRRRLPSRRIGWHRRQGYNRKANENAVGHNRISHKDSVGIVCDTS